jgi:hypothetical protein
MMTDLISRDLVDPTTHRIGRKDTRDEIRIPTFVLVGLSSGAAQKETKLKLIAPFAGWTKPNQTKKN